MKWWKQSKAEKSKNPISIAKDKLFTIGNKKYSFSELLRVLQARPIKEKACIVDNLIMLAFRWDGLLKILSSDLNNDTKKQNARDEFNSMLVNEKGGEYLLAFEYYLDDKTFYYSNADYFELENFIIPIVYELNDVTLDKGLIDMMINYYTKRVVDGIAKEGEEELELLTAENIKKAKNDIEGGKGMTVGYFQHRIDKAHSVSISGLGLINGFIRKYYCRDDDLNRLIYNKAVTMLLKKVRNIKINNYQNNIKINIVKNKMIGRVNAGLIVEASNKNKKIINIFTWLTNIKEEMDYQSDGWVLEGDNTIINVLDSLHSCVNFKKNPPSKSLQIAVLKFTANHPMIDTGWFDKVKKAHTNFIFHPYISKVLQYSAIDEVVIKRMVRNGKENDLIVLSMAKFKFKKKYLKNLLRNIIYADGIRGKYGSERNLSGFSRKLMAEFDWDEYEGGSEYWVAQKYKNQILKNKFNSFSLIEKVAYEVKNELIKKNGDSSLVVFG